MSLGDCWGLRDLMCPVLDPTATATPGPSLIPAELQNVIFFSPALVLDEVHQLHTYVYGAF